MHVVHIVKHVSSGSLQQVLRIMGPLFGLPLDKASVIDVQGNQIKIVRNGIIIVKMLSQLHLA